jgi:hypothetical protein
MVVKPLVKENCGSSERRFDTLGHLLVNSVGPCYHVPWTEPDSNAVAENSALPHFFPLTFCRLDSRDQANGMESV